MTPTETFVATSRRICEAATEGPWVEGGPYPVCSVCIVTDPGCTHPENPSPQEWQPICILESCERIGDGSLVPTEQAMHDRAFIAHARTALPQAIDIIEQQAKRIVELETRIADMQDDANNPPKLRTACEKEPKP